jgi:hypothetical protein
MRNPNYSVTILNLFSGDIPTRRRSRYPEQTQGASNMVAA